MANTFLKDPQAILDYKFNWAALRNGSTDPGVTDWLSANEIINSYVITATALNSGCVISVVDSYLSDSDSSVTVWLGGGDAYKDYLVSCRITTSSSPVARVDERSIKIEVKNL